MDELEISTELLPSELSRKFEIAGLAPRIRQSRLFFYILWFSLIKN